MIPPEGSGMMVQPGRKIFFAYGVPDRPINTNK